MIRAARPARSDLEKLEAMTCVCSVGLDMIAIPGDTSVETIAGIIADECAIGMINSKTTAVRVIPAIGKTWGRRFWSSAACCSAEELNPTAAFAPPQSRRRRYSQSVTTSHD